MVAIQTKVFGAPGTGKTSWLEKRIAKRLKFDGVRPDDVGAFTFTKNEARNLRSRVAKRTGIDEKSLSGISTIHSQCYRMLLADGFNGRLVRSEDRIEFAGLYGFTSPIDLGQDLESGQWLGMDRINPPDYWTAYYQMVTRYPSTDIVDALSLIHTPGYWDETDFIRFCAEWDDFKLDEGLIDFTDMPRLALEESHQVPYKHLFFDEFQDCFPLLWLVAQQWTDSADEVVWGGDPNQCIYTHMGCSPDLFRSLEGRVVVRRVSHRVPGRIWELSKQILEDVPAYREGDFPLSEVHPLNKLGEVKRKDLGDVVSLTRKFEELKEPTFVLARTNHQVRKLAKQLAYGGVSYTSLGADAYGWPDAAMHLMNSNLRITGNSPVTRAQATNLCKLAPIHLGSIDINAMVDVLKVPDVDLWKLEMYLPPGTDLIGAWWEAFSHLGSTAQIAVGNRITHIKKGVLLPQNRHIRIGTGHSAKGREAVNVIAYDRISPTMAHRIGNSNEAHLEESRVWYVICTRARERLFIISDGGGKHYPLPT